MTNFAMNFITLPNQILSLNSSKQTGILPGLRKQSCVIYFLFSLFISVPITLIFSLGSQTRLLQFFLVVFAMVSVFTIGNLFLALRWKWAQGLLGITFVMLPTVFVWLTTINALIFFGGLIVGWSTFFHWWLNWRPVKLYTSIFGFTMNDVLKNQQEFQFFWSQGIFKFLKAKPQTLIGTLLFGSADGWQARIKNLISGLILALLFIALYWALLGPSAIDALSGQADMFFSIAYTSSSFAFQGYLFRNLHKLWMFYPESRDSLLSSLEKFYYPWGLAVMIPLAVIHLTAPVFFAGMKSNIFFTLLLIIFSVTLLALNFYIGIVVYCRSRANYRVVMLISMGVMLVSMVLVYTLYFAWADYKTQLVPFVLMFIFAFFGSTILLRNWAKKCCLEINFLRVKS
ncbi:MAG: hypothetical protein V4660_13340 [Pseudomonadota bacterium]